jgi:hypothetical protein
MIAGSARVLVQVAPVDIDRRDDAVDEQEAAMIDSFTVQHCEHVNRRSSPLVGARRPRLPLQK